jgi:hypothetical protein
MKEMLTHGSQWPTKPITEEDRAADLIEALKFGNHKGATTQPELLLKLVSDDVKYGYTLPLPLKKNKRIPNICMAPLNIQPQWTINERGEIIEKDRLTHDQSFEWEKSGFSDDFKSAYQRLHLHSKTAVKAVTQLPELELALMSCQLTFGGAPGPYKWSAISETVCDLTTAIKHNVNLDPLTLFGINQHGVSPKINI